MRVAITGSSGYLGQAIVAHASADPGIAFLLGLDRHPPPNPSPKLTFFKHNLGAPGLAALFAEHRITHVLHLAFDLTAPANQPAFSQPALAALLAACAAHNIEALIVASSSVVFGAHPENQGMALTEDATRRPEPDLPYANQKVRMEDTLRTFAEANPTCRVVILRTVTIFGPHVNNFISRIMEKPVLTLPTAADPPWQFLHEDDAAAAFLTALRTPIHGTYHLGADTPIPTRQILETLGVPVLRLPYQWLERIADAAWRRGLHGISENPGCVTRYLISPPILDNTKFKRDAGFLYRYNCDQTFRTYAESRIEGTLRPGWLIPLLAVIATLALPLPSLAKLALFLVITALWFHPLTRAERRRAAITFAIFFPMDILSTRQGAFHFNQPDALGLPYYEPVLWPILLLTLGRLYPIANPPKFDPWVIPLTILFAAPFALIADPTLLLLATSAALALLLARYHTKPDLIYPALMIAIGVVWEHTGVWSGQWSYPGNPIGGVPLWSSVLWAGVGLLFYRVLRAASHQPAEPPRLAAPSQTNSPPSRS